VPPGRDLSATNRLPGNPLTVTALLGGPSDSRGPRRSDQWRCDQRAGIGIHVLPRTPDQMTERVVYDDRWRSVDVLATRPTDAAHRVRPTEASPGISRLISSRRHVPRRFRMELPWRLCLRELPGALFPVCELGRRLATNGCQPAATSSISPTAAFEDAGGRFELGREVRGPLGRRRSPSPLDGLALACNYSAGKYDLARFNTIGTIIFATQRRSITVLTALDRCAVPANCDFVIFPPRWMGRAHVPPRRYFFTAT